MEKRTKPEYKCANGDWHDSPEEVHTCDLFQRIRKLAKDDKAKMQTDNPMECAVIAYFLIHNSVLAESLIHEYWDKIQVKIKPEAKA